MGMSSWLYAAYERRLVRELSGKRMPQHVAIMLDGNRRWARELGESATFGHRAGAERIAEVLGWCEDAGIEVVTLWLLSTDNLSRAAEEVGPLLSIICETVENLARSSRFRLVAVGNLDLLSEEYAQRLRAAAASTEACTGLHVNIAVGYGGRQEITDAVRSYLRDEAAAGRSLAEVAEDFSLADITDHLYTRGQPDPDLVIRTSGEQRMSGFMLWQSVHTELYFCETYWPDFRRVDFLRALRDYTQRDRRRGR